MIAAALALAKETARIQSEELLKKMYPQILTPAIQVRVHLSPPMHLGLASRKNVKQNQNANNAQKYKNSPDNKNGFQIHHVSPFDSEMLKFHLARTLAAAQ